MPDLRRRQFITLLGGAAVALDAISSTELCPVVPAGHFLCAPWGSPSRTEREAFAGRHVRCLTFTTRSMSEPPAVL
jgi:hypothetical protein